MVRRGFSVSRRTTGALLAVTSGLLLAVSCGDDVGGVIGIHPSIAVTSPNGDETWTVGETVAVEWSTVGEVGDVKIELSTDGGATWPHELAASTANDGTEPVTVPDAPSTQCRIRVIELDGNPSDVSDADFTIRIAAPAAFALVSPADGAGDVSLTPALDWEDSTGADTYALLVDDDPGFGSPVVNEAALAASDFAVTGPLTLNTTYYWRVTATNATGTTAASNNDLEFTTVPWDGFWKVDIDADAGGDGLTWATAFDHPQYAVDAAFAAGGDEVWVAEGTYERLTGSDTVVLTMKDGVEIYGGFGGIGVNETARSERNPATRVTTLDGEDVAYHVVVGASNATLDGFTVTGGNYPDSWPNPGSVGGGMHNDSVTGLTVRNCIFSNSYATWGGGMHNVACSPVIADCRFQANDATRGGGMLNDGASPTITRCVFEGNSGGMGGGVQNGLGSMAWGTPGSAPIISDCVLLGNAATAGDGGAMRNYQSVPTVVNCVFLANDATRHGGAVKNRESANPTIVNCTFVGNNADLDGGAFASTQSSTGTVVNCVMWANTAPTDPEIFLDTGATIDVAYSCVNGGYAGATNIDADPLFVDAADPDGPDDIFGTADDGLALRSGSPCIDAADGDQVPTADILGNPRHDDPGTTDTGVGAVTHADMGAYEFQGDSSLVGWWRFDETMGTNAEDSSGNANDGTLEASMTDTDWVAGRIGGALDFDGIDDQVSFTSGEMSATTIATWVNVRGTGTSGAPRIVRMPAYFLLFLHTEDHLNFVSVRDGTQGAWQVDLALIGAGWHHLAVVYDSTSLSNDAAFYVDGSLVTSVEIITPTGNMVSNSGTGDIGNAGSTRPFDGLIDDVRIYDRALSAAEVQALYDAGQ